MTPEQVETLTARWRSELRRSFLCAVLLTVYAGLSFPSLPSVVALIGVGTMLAIVLGRMENIALFRRV